MQKEIELIHTQALEVASRFKRAEADLLEILQRVDRNRVFLHFECKSLFDYVVQVLGISEGAAYNLITVARKAVEIPALKEAIRAGTLSVSKARKVTAVLTRGNQDEWIQKAMSLSSRKLEEEVARAISPERGRHVGLHLSLSREVHALLKRAAELECQQQKKTVSDEEVIQAVLEVYLEKQDPVRRAERILQRKPIELVKLVTGQGKSTIGSPHGVSMPKPMALASGPLTAVPPTKNNASSAIPAAHLHEVHRRDQGQCTHHDRKTGLRCEERKWTHVHYVVPRSNGGSHATENLTTLCAAHHRMLHFFEKAPCFEVTERT